MVGGSRERWMNFILRRFSCRLVFDPLEFLILLEMKLQR